MNYNQNTHIIEGKESQIKFIFAKVEHISSELFRSLHYINERIKTIDIVVRYLQ